MNGFSGTAITHDEIGNRVNYYNGSSYIFSWQGKRLVGAEKGSTSMSFTYNDEGLRVTKTVGEAVTTYYYQGSLLIAEETNSQILVYIYDANGALIGFKYRGVNCANEVWDIYGYDKNLQGDIIGVYDITTFGEVLGWIKNKSSYCFGCYCFASAISFMGVVMFVSYSSSFSTILSCATNYIIYRFFLAHI